MSIASCSRSLLQPGWRGPPAGRAPPPSCEWRRAREVQPGHARQQDCLEVAAARRVDVLQRTSGVAGRGRGAVEEVDDAGELGARVPSLELRVVLRILPVPVVLLAERDQDLVDE